MLPSLAIKEFDGFGPCRLSSGCQPPAAELVVPADRREARRRLRRSCPEAPGVYGMVDAEGVLIYVGKSKSLRDRLLSYFSAAGEGSKATRIIGRTERLVWEPGPHEFLALLRELELIRRFRPRLNVHGQPGRRGAAHLCLGRGPAPYVYLATKPSRRADALFGPLAASHRSRRLARLVNDCFGLRDCPQRAPIYLADQVELFPVRREPRCLRRDLGTCLAPCAAGCSGREYEARVGAAREFLEGSDVSMLGRLEEAMRTAAAARQFERAALLRDQWEGLRRLEDHLRRLRDVRRRYAFIYPLRSERRREIWCLVDRGRVAGALPAPRSRTSARRCLRLLEEVYPPRRPGPAPEAPEDLEVVLLVASWFRRHGDDLRRTLSPRKAKRACRQLLDGR